MATADAVIKKTNSIKMRILSTLMNCSFYHELITRNFCNFCINSVPTLVCLLNKLKIPSSEVGICSCFVMEKLITLFVKAFMSLYRDIITLVSKIKKRLKRLKYSVYQENYYYISQMILGSKKSFLEDNNANVPSQNSLNFFKQKEGGTSCLALHG